MRGRKGKRGVQSGELKLSRHITYTTSDSEARVETVAENQEMPELLTCLN